MSATCHVVAVHVGQVCVITVNPVPRGPSQPPSQKREEVPPADVTTHVGNHTQEDERWCGAACPCRDHHASTPGPTLASQASPGNVVLKLHVGDVFPGVTLSGHVDQDVSAHLPMVGVGGGVATWIRTA